MFKDMLINQASRSEKNREYFYRHSLFCLLFFSQFIFPLISPQLISASEFSSVEHKSLTGFETAYSQTSPGLGFQIIGESFLKPQP
ncbi:MAG: hypothetical protein OEY26_09285, partial [Nitrospinota bacterium]|nr:hypothetical protein [Nitrospinota bacterium]